jgi:hypothetical protein
MREELAELAGLKDARDKVGRVKQALAFLAPASSGVRR